MNNILPANLHGNKMVGKKKLMPLVPKKNKKIRT